jgi:predicted DCC family thiol-disulfide oxidoreductase YuxK
MTKNYTERKPNPAEKLMQHGWSILLYDGRCWLCTSIVRFAAQRAGHQLIAFCAVQSDSGRAALNRSIATPRNRYGVLVLEENQVSEGADAMLHIMDQLEGPWAGIASGLRRIPHTVRDWIYNIIVTHRYRVLPKRNQCMFIGPEKLRRYVV